MGKGLLISVSGPSGTGKGSVLAKIKEINPNFGTSISVTTRDPREGEKDGVDYYFKSKDEFMKLGLNWKDYVLLAVCIIVVWVVSLVQERHTDTNIRELLDEKPFILRFILFFAAVMAIIIFGIYGSGYAASDFVYMQF